MTPIDLQIKRSVVSEIHFPNRIDLDNIKSQLHRIKATGKLTIEVYQGGLTSITFVAKNDLNGHDKIELHFNTPTLP